MTRIKGLITSLDRKMSDKENKLILYKDNERLKQGGNKDEEND